VWIKSAAWEVGQSLPVYLDKRTISQFARTSHWGQKATLLGHSPPNSG
jgi:hypothetical protein